MDGPTNDKEKVYRLVLQSYFSLMVFLPKPQHFTGQHKEHNQRTADSSEVTKTALQTASSIWTEAPCQGEFTTSLSVLTDRVPCLHALLSLTSWEENYTGFVWRWNVSPKYNSVLLWCVVCCWCNFPFPFSVSHSVYSLLSTATCVSWRTQQIKNSKNTESGKSIQMITFG